MTLRRGKLPDSIDEIAAAFKAECEARDGVGKSNCDHDLHTLQIDVIRNRAAAYCNNCELYKECPVTNAFVNTYEKEHL